MSEAHVVMPEQSDDELPARESRWRTRTAALVAVLLIVLAIGFSRGQPPFPPRGGGEFAHKSHWGSLISLKIGDTFTEALNVFSLNDEDASPGRFVSVEQVFASEGVEDLGALIAGPERTGIAVNAQFYYRWPPVDSRLGTLLEPGDAPLYLHVDEPMQSQILLGMRAEEFGDILREGYWLTYETGGIRYRDFIHAELTICVSPPDHVEQVSEHKCEFLGEGAE